MKLVSPSEHVGKTFSWSLQEKLPHKREAEASQGNETMIETLSVFDNVKSVRNRETGLIDPTQNENEMHMWTQRVTDNTKREMAGLRKEMNQKLEMKKMMREVKISRRTQPVSNRKNNDKTTSRRETP